MRAPFYFNAGYSYKKNPVLWYFEEQENNAAILSTYANFPKLQEFNTTFNFNHKIAFWQPNYTVALNYPLFSAMYDGREVKYDKLNCLFTAYNDFTLPAKFVFSCNFIWQSDWQYNFVGSKSYRKLDVGMRKSFFDNALRLNLMIYDIFDWEKYRDFMQINNLRWSVNRKSETRYVTLSITWMFNNYSKKYRGGSAAQDDRNRF
jgi:hypothetical protein